MVEKRDTGDEHWRGYPGEPEARSYPVPASARYGLLFALVVLMAMIGAVIFMTTHGG